MVKRWMALSLVALLLLLSGCNREYSGQLFAMDTIMSLTAYGPQGAKAVDQGQALILTLEGALSATDGDSEISALNAGDGQWVNLSPDAIQVLGLALDLAQETGGAVDPTIYPVVRAWGFTTDSRQVPGEETLAALLPMVDHGGVELDRAGGRARLPQGVEVDLGSIAKGYTADRLDGLFRELGVRSALINLGGNVQAVGRKPDGSPWRVGVQDPAAEGTAYLAVLSVEDSAVVTSGGYQRYFEVDGVRYWHLLDPETGLPARTGLGSVTVVGPSGARCDALSTALFVLGEERGTQLWRQLGGFQVVFVREDGSVAITQGLQDGGQFRLAQGYEDRRVEVIAP